MDDLKSGLSGKVYRKGSALPGLGEGFYRGFDGTREVTLRIAPPEATAVVALRLEAMVLLRLRHPQIVSVSDRGRTTGAYFLVLDAPAEQPLTELMHQTDLSAIAAVDIMLQLVSVLEAVHNAGIVWGRLRPSAFWVDKSGRLKLVDVRGMGAPTPDRSPTLAEATYLAPEQSTGQPPIVQSDLYACGVVLYELLAGQPPFVGASPAELALKHLSEPPPDLGQLRPDLPPDLVALVQRCLAKSPGERLASTAASINEYAARGHHTNEWATKAPSGRMAAALRQTMEALQQQLRIAEQAHMLICPRCQARVPAATHCPICNRPLAPPAAPAAAPVRRRSRYNPIAVIIMMGSLLVSLLISLASGGSHSSAAVPAGSPTSAAPAPHPSAAPTRSPTPLPTGTAVPVPPGAIQDAADDVAEQNIDLIRARVAVERGALVTALEVVGQIERASDDVTYQFLLDTDHNSATGSQTPWPGLGADQMVLYRGGEAGMVLRWDGSTWQGIGAATVELTGGKLALQAPAEWFTPSNGMRYGVLAANPQRTLADYAPVQDSRDGATAGN